MLHCESADPLRRRIHNMKAQGSSDDAIVNAIVREQGVVALSSPPSNGFGGILSWVMPGIVLLIGFLIYGTFVRRNRQESPVLSPADHKLIGRFQDQIDHEFEDHP